MRLLVLSDIHANVSALYAVFRHAETYAIDRLILLGDHIDYGMRPNQIINLLRQSPYPVDVNLWGNHEKAIMDGDLSRFSSDRGRDFSRLTGNMLSAESKDYINHVMTCSGYTEKEYDGKRYLMVHGSLADCFWESISPGICDDRYRIYDYVLSGHSHLPHCFDMYYPSEDDTMRRRKKTAFINPGSVGQPRNHNPRACYAVVDTAAGWVHLNNIEYDISAEQELFSADVDEFYRLRLERGL